MNDFRKISYKDSTGRYRKLLTRDVLQWHSESLAFITSMLKESREPVVLMSLHAPSRQSIPFRYQNDRLSAAYASDLNGLFETTRQQPAVAVHRHIHQSQDHLMPCGTRVLANPYGYHDVEKNSLFNLSSLVSVDEHGEVNVFVSDKVAPD